MVKDEKITDAEWTFCMYKKGAAGSGMTALIDAIFKLDSGNRAKLALGYPELVEVCNRYNEEPGYWQNLVERWNSQGGGLKMSV